MLPLLAALTGGQATALTIVAVILFILGVVRLVRGDVPVGVLLIVVALLVGPGGVSLFH